MRRFLYFLGGLDGNPLRDAVVVAFPELAYAFPRGGSLQTVACSAGPGGMSGVFAASGDARGLAYDPATQEWQRIGERAWLGWTKDGLPGPEELEAPELCNDSVPVLLADGRTWYLPVARYLNGDTGLPRFVVVDPDTGQAVFRVRPEYARLFSVAAKVADIEVLGGVRKDRAGFDAEDVMTLAELGLGVNYRVSRWEISALQVLDTGSAARIADALLDGESLKRLLEDIRAKKNSVASPPGPACATGGSA